jgi:hypothetical protein
MALSHPVVRSAGAAALVALLLVLFGLAAPAAAAAPTGGVDTGLTSSAGSGPVVLANAGGLIIAVGFLIVVGLITLLFVACVVAVWVWRRHARARGEL